LSQATAFCKLPGNQSNIAKLASFSSQVSFLHTGGFIGISLVSPPAAAENVPWHPPRAAEETQRCAAGLRVGWNL